MPTTTSLLADTSTVAICLLLIMTPGLLIGASAGLRGWILVGSAPVMTYAVGGLAGPWLALIGVPFNVITFGITCLLFIGLACAVRKLALHRSRTRNEYLPLRLDNLWTRYGHFAVAACLIAAAGVGMYTMLDALGGKLNDISQGYDAVYHANAIRYIAETGDGSLFGTSNVNWYADGNAVFYPNGYHLIGAIAYLITGAAVPTVMNAIMILLPGLFALSLVTLVRVFRGRAVLAGAAALVTVASSVAAYEAMRGPLLPYSLGLAFLPIAAVLLIEYLRRPALTTGLVLTVTVLGLLAIHPSMAFSAILLVVPLILQRWWSRSGEETKVIARDTKAILPVFAISAVLGGLHLTGALSTVSGGGGGGSGGGGAYSVWPSDSSAAEALGSLLLFQHFLPHPQLWLGGALFLGVLFFTKLRELRWVGVSAVLMGGMFVAVASSNHPLVLTLSRPWWDDPYRFIAMASIPLCLIAAHGLAETQAWLRDQINKITKPKLSSRVLQWSSFSLAVLVLAFFVVGSNGLYERANASLVAPSFGNNPDFNQHILPVTTGEAQAMIRLGKLAKPGEWAVNGRTDGTAWTYALSGVRTVAGHFKSSSPPPSATLLMEHFNEYESNAQVRSAVERLNVKWVIVGQHGYPVDAERAPGLRGLDEAPFVKLVYRNADASLYRIIPDPGKLVS